MNDQEQDLQQQKPPLQNQQDLFPIEGSLKNRLSLLHLNHRSMESTITDNSLAPSPTRTPFSNHTPLKRRSSPSAPLQISDSDAGYRQMVSDGYLVLPLPNSGNERGSPLLQRTSSGSSTNSNFLNPPPVNHTRRPLFAPPVTAGHALPPPHPLSRTISDPMPFSEHENPILQNREIGYAPRGNASGLDSTQDLPSSKRLKRIRIHRIRQQMKQLIDEMAIHQDPDAQIDDPDPNSTPADDKVVSLNCNGGSEEVAAPELDKEIDEEAEGTVSAERIGDSTNLEFKCRCGSGYSVWIIGRNCFYKLI